MEGYILYYGEDIVTITNDKEKWLEENNKIRIEEGEEIETEDTFYIKEVTFDIY